MNKPTMATMALFAVSLTVGCGKGNENDSAAPAAEKTETKTPTAMEAPPPATEAKATDAESLVCCAFGDAIGTATAAKCAEFKGKEVPNLAPPCTK